MLDPACAEWEEFPATSRVFAMLDGFGNHDHFVTDGYEGFSLRLYSPEETCGGSGGPPRARPGRLDPPVEGRFSADGTTAPSRPPTSSTASRCACASTGRRSRRLRPLGAVLLVRRGRDMGANWTMLPWTSKPAHVRYLTPAQRSLVTHLARPLRSATAPAHAAALGQGRRTLSASRVRPRIT